MKYSYKYEKFKFPDFPVYSSVQKGMGALVVPHFHKAAELILVLEGECGMNIDTTVLKLRKNDLVFVPPFCVHHVTSENENTVIKGITFDPSLLELKNADFVVESLFDKAKIKDYIIKNQRDKGLKIIKNFSLEGDGQTLEFRLEIMSQLLSLGAIIAGNFEETKPDTNHVILKPALDYIQANFKTEIHISDLSRLINVCDDHFIRLFRSATNKTPIKYINDMRIEEALKLLIDSDLSITEISENLGFSSVNYMIKVFKGNLNTTPKAYRKSLIQGK